MKHLVALFFVLISWVCFAQPAETMTSPNLISSANSVSTVTGVTSVTHNGGGVTGGSTPGYNSTTNTIMMGYVTGTAAYKYAFSQALQNSGMTLLGYNYSWDYLNQDTSRGALAAQVSFDSTGGRNLHTRNWSLGPTEGWTNITGTTAFDNPLGTANIASFKLSFTGKDDRYWAGYYGPQVRNASMSLNYTFDSCSSNPLSSPDCPGYTVAYKTQQCTINPLYAADCPGYALAYKTQQCTINPLYAADCPGYAVAYKTQQCTATPLYATDCPGYAEAYFNQQCLADSLFSNKCTGYKTAYAIKYLTNLDPAVTTAVNSTLTNTVEVQRNDPANVVSSTGNATVDSVIAAPVTTSATSVTSPISVINSSPSSSAMSAATAPPAPPPPEQAAEQKSDAKKTDGAVASIEKKSGGNAAAAKSAATTKAKELANNMSKAATMEEQAATQGLLVGLIGYVPGFSAYQNSLVPDYLGASVAKQYYKDTVDNRSAQRQLSGANETRWKQIVDSQYNKE